MTRSTDRMNASRPPRRVSVALALALLPLPSSGCGPANVPLHPVEGRILFKGKPVVEALVVFHPHDGGPLAAHKPLAQTGPDGRFQLALDKSPHILPGWYRVSLAPAPAVPSAPAVPAFPAKLARPDLSGIEREVHTGRDHDFEIAVEVPAQ